MPKSDRPTKLSPRILARAAQIGLTIVDPQKFEALGAIDVIAIGKASTLTQSQRSVEKIRLAFDSPLMHTDELLALAAGVEQHVQHPIAESITAEATRLGIEPAPVLDVMTIPGHGVSGILNGETILVGGPVLLTSRNIPIYVDDLVRSDAANQLGNTVCYVVRGSQLLGMIELAETVAVDAEQSVRAIHAKKIRVALITGDATGVAEKVTKEVGIAELFAEVLPNKKDAIIRQLKSDGSKVALAASLDVDSLALAEAHVGIAINSNGHMASTAVGLHLVGSSAKDIMRAVLLARSARNRIHRTYLFALAGIMVLFGIGAIVMSAL